MQLEERQKKTASKRLDKQKDLVTMKEATLTVLQVKTITTTAATIEAPITVGNARSNSLQEEEVGSVVVEEEMTTAEVTTVVVTDDD
jgi:hypothetical protein